MTENPSSHNLEEILAGYVLGNLDEAELVWLNEQLAANPELRQEVMQLESTLNMMPYGLPQDTPTSNLRDRILNQAQPKAQPKKYNWGFVMGVATAVSALLLGVHNLSLRQQIAIAESRLQQQQDLIAVLRQPNSQLVTLTARDNSISTSGSLFISHEQNKAVLTLENLGRLSGGRVYRLWAISQGKKIGCSNFKPNNKGEVHLNLSSDDAIFDATSILITIEPTADTEQPLGEEFLSGSYSTI